MKSLSLILLFILPNLVLASGIDQATDSSLLTISTSSGISKIHKTLDYCKTNYYKNPATCIDLCKDITSLVRNTDSVELETRIYNYIGLCYWIDMTFDSSIFYLKKAQHLLPEVQNPKLKASVYNNLSKHYSDVQILDSAIQFGLKALTIQEKLKDTLTLASTLSSIGKIYIYLDDLESALSYQQQAKELLILKENPRMLGKIENTIGYIFDEMQAYDSAISHYHNSILLRRKTNDLVGELYTMTNQCVAYRNINKNEEALNCNQNALALSRKLGATEVEAVNLLNIGINLSDLGKYTKSIQYLDTAYPLLSASQDIRNLRETEGMYWYNYEKIGDYKNSLTHYKKYKELADSLLTLDKFTAVEDLRTKYESDKKEASNKLLLAQKEADTLKIQKKSNTITGLIVVFILVIGLAILIINQRRIRQKSLLVEKELEKQVAVTMAEITSRENERKRISQELHDGIGQQLTAINFAWESQNNQSKDDKLTTLIQSAAEDVRNISHQMMPKSLTTLGLEKALEELVSRIPKTSELTIKFHGFFKLPTLPENVSINIYRIVQECLNNAIKHSQATNVDLMITGSGDKITFTIEDNGIGVNPDSSNGHGLQNIETRAKAIGGNFTIESSNSGTICRLTV